LGNAIICQSKNLEAFAKKYCKKTCGYCNDGTTTTSPSPFNRVTSATLMLLFLIISCLLPGVTEGGITDLNCTHRVGADIKYSQSAVNCNNKISDAACLVIYTEAVKAEGGDDRNEKCRGDPVNPALVQAAIDICPKTCGYCCLTPAFLCENKLQPRIPCSSVTQDMCENPAWRSILEEDCPKTCGFCNSGSCIDEAPGCGLDNAFICQSKNLETFAKKYCKKTCGYCNDATTTSPGQPFNRVTPAVFMLLFLIFSSALIGGSEAGITDLNCTEMVGGSAKYAQSAVNCNNKISDAACLVIYTTAVKANDDTDRNEKCDGNPVVRDQATIWIRFYICILLLHTNYKWGFPSFR
uniref:ShKT domain-containing protein n=1 Tax=Haemonchus placei TaxID=6290 RepID=A0A0N4X4L9_HAEPC